MQEPSACSTARLAKFSDAMSSMPVRWRVASSDKMPHTSGSKSDRSGSSMVGGEEDEEVEVGKEETESLRSRVAGRMAVEREGEEEEEEEEEEVEDGECQCDAENADVEDSSWNSSSVIAVTQRIVGLRVVI